MLMQWNLVDLGIYIHDQNTGTKNKIEGNLGISTSVTNGK